MNDEYPAVWNVRLVKEVRGWLNFGLHIDVLDPEVAIYLPGFIISIGHSPPRVHEIWNAKTWVSNIKDNGD